MVLNKGKFENLGLANDGNMQSALLTAIARSAEDLTTGRGWPDGVNNLLGDLGKISGVSRVWIFQTLELTEEYIIQDYTFEWASKKQYIQIGLPFLNKFKTKINEPVYKGIIDSRIKGEYQKFIIDKIPASLFQSGLKKQNIKSMLTIPITVENEWWGTLGFDDCEREYNWADSEIALLRTTGFLISSAVLRDRLKAKRKQIDILQKITACSAWQYDIRRGYLWSTSEIFRSTPGKTDNLQFSFRSILKKIHIDDRKKFLNNVRNYIKNGNNKFRCDVRILMECGDYRWVELIGTIDNDPGSKHDQLAGIAIDITSRKNAEDQLKHEAATDPLTGVLNRRKMDQIVQKQLDSSIETGDIFSFLMLDIDHFKKINDTYGHPTGDKILIHFVDICRECLRKNDYLARVGGEEFAILLPETEESAAKSIGNRIRETVERTP
ncbi:MAG: diguanylate cyclase, partial [Desulfobacteraceae bacterium]|nr:diguanylate cyclase [Desulfobacteraceae bacterium]